MNEGNEPMVTVGDFDEAGCWHPRWMDEDGAWHPGWGWVDDDGVWQVELGHYDPAGVWVPQAVLLDDSVETPVEDDESSPYIGRFDRQTVPYIGSSGAAHAAFLIFAMMMPDAAGALDLDGYNAQDRFVQAALTEFQEEKPPEAPGWEDDDAAAVETAKHAGEEGEAGDPAEVATDKRIAIEGPKNNEDLEIARARNLEIAMDAGIASSVGSLFANHDVSVGSDALHALGNLDGADPGNSKGIFGMGVSDAGRGGGGRDGDSLGRHIVDTSGLSGVERGCRGTKCGTGSGTGIDGWDKETKLPPRVIAGTPSLIGALDREIIQRIVREHRRELKFCYEQQLQKDKTITGELMVKFTVGPTGDVIAAVTDSDASSLKNAAVSSCVTSKIRRWVFPRSPNNPGMVIVRYPFRFSPGG